jgi:hypothetical protein
MMVKKGVADDDDDNDKRESVKPITSPCDSVSRYWVFSGKKSV